MTGSELQVAATCTEEAHTLDLHEALHQSSAYTPAVFGYRTCPPVWSVPSKDVA